jgi:5-methyltetrahydrofolate--homocysteine methyltransferase
MALPGFRDRLRQRPPLIADGATGTTLQSRGLALGRSAEAWVLEMPERILELHRDFIDAGAEIVLTCSFGATPLRLRSSGLADRAGEINRRAAELARQAVGEREVYVAGSMGPTGEMLKPYGDLDEAGAVAAYSVQAAALAEGGVDLLVLETHFDLAEAAAAVKGAREATSLPIVCSFSYDRGTRTMMGVSSAQAGRQLDGLGVDAIGINCGRSLDESLRDLAELRESTDRPLWFKPNAGMPTLDAQGRAVYEISPREMAEALAKALESDVAVLGGCCGTSPAHLRQIALEVRRLAAR